MNGNCYSSDGVNPTLTTNKGEGNKVVIPVLTPDRANKRQNGRRFKEDGDEAFTLTGQDRHGVAIEIEPLKLNGHNVSASGNEAHALNCTDQRKAFGAHQSRTMVGYNATLKRGGGTTQTALTLNARDYKGLSGSNQMMTAAMMYLQNKTGRNTDMCERVKHPGLFVQISENLTVYAVWYPKKECYVAIRKLTPKECFRLQGWSDDDFEKAQFVNSDSQLYKQAGNGVTVSVIEAIANKMKQPEEVMT